MVLGIDAGTLDVFKRLADDGAALREVIKVWLKRVNPMPTLKALVKALRDQTISERTLANEIAKNHCPSEVEKGDECNCNSGIICIYKEWGTFSTPPPPSPPHTHLYTHSHSIHLDRVVYFTSVLT